DRAYQHDEDGEQGGHREHDDEPADDRPPPQVSLCGRERQVSHGQPPSLVRPRSSPATMTWACSIVVLSSFRAAVLWTDSVSESSIALACRPIERASSRIGTTRATTTRTTTIVIV